MKNLIRAKSKLLFILVVICSYILVNANFTFGQCGIPGTPPCRSTNKTIKKKSVTKKHTSNINPSKNLNSNIENTIPGYSGILVETLDGKIIKESYSNYAFNPASNVQIATSYSILKTFGPEYRFPTNVFTDGTIDSNTGTLTGNLYISGRDPVFNYEHGVALAIALNKLGIKQVSGDLIVTNSFVMALNGSNQHSAETLFSTLDASKRSAAATRAWQEYLMSSGKLYQTPGIPSISFGGKVFIDIIPSNARLLFSHESAPLKEIVKVTMCFSNNFLAEKLGDMLGGAYAVSRIVQLNTSVGPEEFVLETSSGLGINRVTPRAMMRLLRTFRAELNRYKMTFADVMPIAGVDPGTLQNRFTSFDSVGSIVGKTGTLGNTDGGASALSGEMQTKNGKMLFVIFNQKGVAQRFQNFQDDYISMIQNQNGGAASLGYSAISLPTRMSNTRVVYPTAGFESNSTNPIINKTIPERKAKTNNEENSPFKAEYVGGNVAPSVQIENGTDRLMNMVLDGKLYKIEARSTKTVILEPGSHNFSVSAWRVQTYSGSRTFDRGYIYTWRFYIK